MRKLALLFTLLLALVPTPAQANDRDDRDSGCVTTDQRARLAPGQRLRFVHRVVGHAEIERSTSQTAGGTMRERVYALCESTPLGYDTLIARFVVYSGAWRALLIDDHIGPDDIDA